MRHCPFCGAQTSPPAQFCQQCGRAQPEPDAEAAGSIDHETLYRLRGERARLSRKLTSLREAEKSRPLTADERRSWNHLLSAWKDISAELSRLLAAVAPRQETDRRSGERRERERRGDDSGPDGDERRSGLQRRMRQRRKGRDRRKPFGDEKS